MIDLLLTYQDRTGKANIDMLKEVLDKLKNKKQTTDQDKAVGCWGFVHVIYFITSVPYFIYLAFSMPSIPTIGILVVNIMQWIIGKKRSGKVCDVLHLAFMIWIGFLIY